MSRPINPSSTHSRVLALLAVPMSVESVAAALGIDPKPASRAIWHLRRRGFVRIVARRPQYLYSTGEPIIATYDALGALRAMQLAAQQAGTYTG